MDLRNRLMKLLEKGSELEKVFFESLSEDEIAASGTFEEWSASDVLGHCAFWVQDTAVNMEKIRSGEEPKWIEDYNAKNKDIFNGAKDSDLETARAAFSKAVLNLQEEAHQLTEEQLEDTSYLGLEEQRPAWHHILGSGYLHILMHLADYWIKHGRGELVREAYREMEDLVLPLDDDPIWQGTVIYNRACMEALTGDTERALNSLKRAFDLRPDLIEWAKQDGDLVSLHGTPAYNQLTS